MTFPFLNTDVAIAGTGFPVSCLPSSNAGGTKFSTSSTGGAPFDAIGFNNQSSPDKVVSITQALLNHHIVLNGTMTSNFSPLSYALYAGGPHQSTGSATLQGKYDELAYILTGMNPMSAQDMHVAQDHFAQTRDTWLGNFVVSADGQSVSIIDPVLETTYLNWHISDPAHIMMFFTQMNLFNAAPSSNNAFGVAPERTFCILADDLDITLGSRDTAFTASISSTGLDSVVPVVTSTPTSLELDKWKEILSGPWTPTYSGYSTRHHMFEGGQLPLPPGTQIDYSLAFRFDDSGDLRLADPKVLYRYMDSDFVQNNTLTLANWEWQPLTMLDSNSQGFAFVGKTYLSTGEVKMDLNLGLPSGGGEIEAIPYTSVEFAHGALTDPIIFTRSGLPNGETMDCMAVMSGLPANISAYVVFFETNQAMAFLRDHNNQTVAKFLFNLRFGSSTRPGNRAWKRTVSFSLDGTQYSFDLHMKVGVRSDSSFPDFAISGRLGLHTVSYMSGRDVYSRSLGQSLSPPTCTFKVGTICRMNHKSKTGTKTLSLIYE